MGESGGGGGGNPAGATTAGPTLYPPYIKIEKPPKFSGKHSELENFLFAMRLYLDSSGLTGQSATRFLVSYLVGDALTWWRQYCTRHDGIAGVFTNLDADDVMDHL